MGCNSGITGLLGGYSTLPNCRVPQSKVVGECGISIHTNCGMLWSLLCDNYGQAQSIIEEERRRAQARQHLVAVQLLLYSSMLYFTI